MEKPGAVSALYPTPTTLVGALVDGNPNFITIAHIGIMTGRKTDKAALFDVFYGQLERAAGGLGDLFEIDPRPHGIDSI